MTESIFLIGGFEGDRLWSYDIKSSAFSNNGSLSYNNQQLKLGRVDAQSSVQWNNYIIFAEKGYLYQFDITTKQIDNAKSAMQRVSDSPCLATDGINVYVIGGQLVDNPNNLFQQYELTTGIWKQNDGKPMKEARRRHACALHDGFLYAFGGLNVNSNEKISVGDVIGDEWTYIAYNGTTNVYWHRAVVQKLYNQIYLVGGRNSDTLPSSNIQLYDVASNIIRVLDVKLNVARSSPAAIIVDNSLYVFGGYDGSNRISSWERSNELTLEPTNYPSTIPTMSTSHPTSLPTKLPSSYPTQEPTVEPTQYLSHRSSLFNSTFIEKELDSTDESLPQFVLFIVIGSFAFCCILCAIIVLKCCDRHKSYRYDEGTIVNAQNVELNAKQTDKKKYRISSISGVNDMQEIAPGSPTGDNATSGFSIGVSDQEDDAASEISENEQTLGGINNEKMKMNDTALPMDIFTKSPTVEGNPPIGVENNVQTPGFSYDNDCDQNIKSIDDFSEKENEKQLDSSNDDINVTTKGNDQNIEPDEFIVEGHDDDEQIETKR